MLPVPAPAGFTGWPGRGLAGSPGPRRGREARCSPCGRCHPRDQHDRGRPAHGRPGPPVLLDPPNPTKRAMTGIGSNDADGEIAGGDWAFRYCSSTATRIAHQSEHTVRIGTLVGPAPGVAARRPTTSARTVVGMRDGVPLPGATPPAVISKLAHRVFGPLRPDRVRAMLDYHGLAGHPAAWRVAVAARHGVTTRTVPSGAAAVKAAGPRCHCPGTWPPNSPAAPGRVRTTSAGPAPRPPWAPPPRARRHPHPPRPAPRGTGPRPRSPPGSWPRSARFPSPSYRPRSAGPADTSPCRR